MGEIVLVMTVRNERDLLRHNVTYHHFIGVDRCYVYDDGSTDDTVATVSDLPFVVVRHSSDAANVPIPPTMTEVSDDFKRQAPWRQLLNLSQVVAEARATGVDWVVALDADELVAVDLTRPTPGGLKALLMAQPKSVEGVVFRPLEAMQRRVAYEDVMAQETLFKRTDTKHMRQTFDPFNRTTHEVRSVYGHRSGKMAIRPALQPAPITNHRFMKPDGERLKSRELGHLLHYYSHDFDAFVRKFRLIKDYPDQHIHGQKVVLQKRLWRDVVNRAGMDETQLRDYYERWVMFSDEDIAAMQRRSRLPWKNDEHVVEVTTVRETLRLLGETSAV